MSGTRYFNFREGDRSEYLATYFFSAIGLVTPVPRQEDIGFDLVCSIADQEVGRLTFNEQFIVSVKSLGTPDIVLEPAKSEDGSLPHIHWLFLQELPLLLAVVDKKSQDIRVYSTLPIWFIYFENHDCGALTLKPRLDTTHLNDVGRPTKGLELEELPGRFHYTVDLGHPILHANVSDLTDRQAVIRIKNRLRGAVHFGRLSILQIKLGVPYFYWFAKTHPDETPPTPAFYAQEFPAVQEAQDAVFGMIAPTLISLSMLFKTTGDQEKLNAALQLLALVPANRIPEPVHERLPELKFFQRVPDGSKLPESGDSFAGASLAIMGAICDLDDRSQEIPLLEAFAIQFPRLNLQLFRPSKLSGTSHKSAFDWRGLIDASIEPSNFAQYVWQSYQLLRESARTSPPPTLVISIAQQSGVAPKHREFHLGHDYNDPTSFIPEFAAAISELRAITRYSPEQRLDDSGWVEVGGPDWEELKKSPRIHKIPSSI
jgi:hypothetical protein